MTHDDSTTAGPGPSGMAELMRSFSVFAGLDPEILVEIAAIATPLELVINQSLVRQGDPGDGLFVIVSGEVDVVLELASGARQPLARLGAGDCVGEIALLSRRPRSASVIARGMARVLRIGATELELVMTRHPSVRAQLVSFASRRLPSLRLASTGMFVGVDPAALERFDREAHWVRLRGGEALVRQGDQADDMFVVVHGSLETKVVDRHGRARLVDVLGPGASIGEMALLMDEPRSATVRALRDSELVRIPKADFLQLLTEYPSASVALARTLAHRLRQTTSTPQVTRLVRTVVLVPSHHDGMPGDFGVRLAESLRASGNTVLRLSSATVDAELGAAVSQTPFDGVGNGRLLHWLNECEAHSRYVVYECDAALTAWTQRCLRQADLVLVVALAGGDPEPGDAERAIWRTADGGPDAHPARYELALLHPTGATRPNGTARWLHARAAGPLSAHHHIRLDRTTDIARVARSIAGASLGLALSGGGARGFAQIGVLRALTELGLQADIVGGASMGAVLAGLVAMGHDPATILEMSRRAFGGLEVLRDLTPPLVALTRGASSVRLLQSLFGDVQIEDLWIPYFCVSANLSRAEVVVHDEGPLWLWTRASSAVPGITPPVPYRGDLLVDGGVLNNLPADVMRDRCRGAVIVVDVSAEVELWSPIEHAPDLSGWPLLARSLNPFDTRAPFPNILRILSRSATLSSVHNQGAMREIADLYLHPPTDQVDPLKWKAIDEVADLGYRYAYDRIAEWKQSASRFTGEHATLRRTSSMAVGS